MIAAHKSQMEVVFYNLNDRLEIDAERFPMESEAKVAVLLINYFGLKTLNNRSHLCDLSAKILLLLKMMYRLSMSSRRKIDG